MNSPKTILIIEDQGTMRRNLALLLEMEGYTVVTAENGRLGVEVAKREQPDVILCDIMMPEMDGYAVVQTLRERLRPPPPGADPASPGRSRADLHTAILHRPPNRGASPDVHHL